ncbi:MAG: hypothetical protein IKA04_00965 [Alistipes sp.]|nr:hypothetical protein [Alistipes sp.]
MKKIFTILAIAACALFVGCDKVSDGFNKIFGDGDKFSLKGQWVMDELNESDFAKFKTGYDFSVTMAGKVTIFQIIEESKHDLLKKGEYYSTGIYTDYVENFSSEGDLIGITIISGDGKSPLGVEVLNNDTIELTTDNGPMIFKRVATKPLLEFPKLVE